ncbi:ATP-binding protein [Fictibacillus enclensis]|uniref:ATP-binding protein n=1 Tax=Fictibacillus enclensis TaxID=1017270 RepID=UPI0025A22B2D|nr:ATP-binding protein [Fictibacillus enclensis]MDM5335755.1 ATP-binding protein [Fictibacillus enclensis]
MNSFIKIFQKKSKRQPNNLSFKEMLFQGEIITIACRLAQYLNTDYQIIDKLLLGLKFPSISDGNTETRRLLDYAKLIYRWANAGVNINETLKNYNDSPMVKSVLLKTFEEYKHELDKKSNLILKDLNKDYDSNQQRNDWEIYRDVIYAASQKKFLLISEEDANHILIQGDVLYRRRIEKVTDIPSCREEVKESLKHEKIPSVNSLLLVISEATTNVIKHAEEGEIVICEHKNSLHIIVSDKGPGYLLKELPNMILLAGYSTKKSLGQGFTLMSKIVDQIQLAQTKQGSILVLVFALKEEGDSIHA